MYFYYLMLGYSFKSGLKELKYDRDILDILEVERGTNVVQVYITQ